MATGTLYTSNILRAIIPSDMQKDESVFVDVNIFTDILRKRQNWESSLKIHNADKSKPTSDNMSTANVLPEFLFRSRGTPLTCSTP